MEIRQKPNEKSLFLFLFQYLGCVEVYESRGMQVCEEALKVLRNSRRRTIKGVLYVSGDGLRVVDADNKAIFLFYQPVDGKNK